MTRRELDHRVSDGIRVTLFWYPAAKRVAVEVHDESTGETFEVDAPPSRALDAFHHPYAYAAARGVADAARTRSPETALLD